MLDFDLMEPSKLTFLQLLIEILEIECFFVLFSFYNILFERICFF